MAFTTFWNGFTCLVDFNKSTGVISNPISLSLEKGGYGVSFSPNSSKLYVSGIDTTNYGNSNNCKIYQFDISLNNQTLIQNSRTTVYTDPNGMFRSLKLGVDGKIYASRGHISYLGVINNPDNNGLSCNYIHNGIYLNGLQGQWGLNNAIEDSVLCSDITTSISKIRNETLISIYPNPFSSSITLDLKQQTENSDVDLIIYNVLGQEVKKVTKISSPSITIDRGSLPNGIYIYKLIENNKLLTSGKIVAE